MSNESIVITREALYSDVWARPIVHVAKHFGLSGRGLGKICARHRIPVPPRGWWAKKRHGHRVRQPALPPVVEAALTTIVLNRATSRAADEDASEYAREKSAEWAIVVSEELPILHPLVCQAAAALRRASRDVPRKQPIPWQERNRAHFVNAGPGFLDITVSNHLVPRALRIMEGLLEAFERRGYPVSVTAEGTEVRVLDEPFQIALTERLTQVRVTRPWGTGVELKPSGRLALRAGFSYRNTEITDRPPRLLEGALNRLLAELVRRALSAKRERALLEESESRWRLHDDERRQRGKARHTERLRRQHLRAMAARWERQRRLAQFLEAVEQRAAADPREQPMSDTARWWIAWTRQYLQGRDSVKRFLDEPWPDAPLPPAASMPWDWK